MVTEYHFHDELFRQFRQHCKAVKKRLKEQQKEKERDSSIKSKHE